MNAPSDRDLPPRPDGGAPDEPQEDGGTMQPLPGEDIALVSDGYNPQRSGWADAAYKSSIHYLNQRFDMGLPGLERTARRR